jgi:hypothetical protein
MRYAALSLVYLLTAIATFAEGPFVTAIEVPTPAAASSVGPSFASGPDDTTWLSWVEPGSGATPSPGHQHDVTPRNTAINALKFATLDASTRTWTAPKTIAADATVTTSNADFPQLAIDGHRQVYALWTDGHGGARLAQSPDGGTSWSVTTSWEKEDREVEKFALQRLNEGRVLVTWLDGRGRKAGGKRQQLYARFADAPQATDLLVDPSVCDCCQTSIAPFLDGGALVGYRGRTADEIRDIRIARLQSAAWTSPRPLSNDGWKVAACPINGPRLASDGGRVAAAWFTAANNEPRVFASYSPDAGGRWLAPLRLDGGKPVGHADVALLHDGAILVVWLEADGSLWLRRITPEFNLTEPVQLEGPGLASTRGVPRLAMLRDYAGGRTMAQLLVAFTRDLEPAGVRTLLVNIPEGDFLMAERNCNCAPTAEQLQGISIRGLAMAVDAATNEVRIAHREVPGVFAAGTHDFHVTPTVLTTVEPAHDFIGRIEQHRDGTWWLFDIQQLAEPVRSR